MSLDEDLRRIWAPIEQRIRDDFDAADIDANVVGELQRTLVAIGRLKRPSPTLIADFKNALAGLIQLSKTTKPGSLELARHIAEFFNFNRDLRERIQREHGRAANRSRNAAPRARALELFDELTARGFDKMSAYKKIPLLLIKEDFGRVSPATVGRWVRDAKASTD